MALGIPYISITTLNVNGLNPPIKRRRMARWILKDKIQIICCLQEIPFSFKDIHKFKVKGWQKIFHVRGKQRNEGQLNLYQTK